MSFSGNEARVRSWIADKDIRCVCGAAAFGPLRLIKEPAAVPGRWASGASDVYGGVDAGTLVQLACTQCGRITLLDAQIIGAIE